MRSLAAAAIGLVSVLAGAASAAMAPDPRAAEATGTLRILVIRATWGPTLGAETDVRPALDDAAAFYRRSSFGRLDLEIELTPWLPAYPAETCPGQPTQRSVFGRLGELAQDAARAAGYDPSAYGRLVYSLPAGTCPIGGLGVGREVFLSGNTFDVHELGHTFGLPHARASACARGCALVEYGDPYSPMGHGHEDFTALEKLRLGWISTVARAPGPGTYGVGPIDQPSERPQALVVQAAAGEYWIEHRVEAPHLLVRLVVPNDPRDPTFLRSVFLGEGDRRYDARGAFSISAASSDAPEIELTFRWTDRTPPTRPRLRVEASGGSAVVSWSASRDAGSGIADYRVRLDGRTVETTTRRRAILPVLSPGPHRITVQAADRAGNHAASAVRITVA